MSNTNFDDICKVTSALFAARDIDKFHTLLDRTKDEKTVSELFDILLMHNQKSLYAHYTIRAIFIRHPTLLVNKTYKNLNTKYDFVNFLLISYYDKYELSTYKSIDFIHKMNLVIIEKLGFIYFDIPIIPAIYDVIYLCEGADIRRIFEASDSLCLPAFKHMIFTRNFSIDAILRSMSKIKILRIFKLLEEPYDVNYVMSYIQNVNNIRKLTNRSYCNYQINWDMKYLYECLPENLETETLLHLYKLGIHLQYIRFFEQLGNIESDPTKKYCVSTDSVWKDEEYLPLLKILSKKCLTKYMEKLGAYESSDNLNERHLIDLIMTFVK